MAKRGSGDKKFTAEQIAARKAVNALTQDQLDQLGKDGTRLWEQANQQLREYVTSLEFAIRAITKTDGTALEDAMKTTLINSARLTRLTTTKRETVKGNDNKPQQTLSLVYEYDDFIFDFFRLEHPDLVMPKKFVDDFRSMTVMPKDVPQHKALPMTKESWKSQLRRQKGRA